MFPYKKKTLRPVQGFIRNEELFLPPGVHTENECQLLADMAKAVGTGLAAPLNNTFISAFRAHMGMHRKDYELQASEAVEVLAKVGENRFLVRTVEENNPLYAIVSAEDLD